MKNLFSFDSPIMNMLRQFADLIILNLLWVLGCVPIVTIGASTTALYQSIIKMRKEGAVKLWPDFWRYFRNNFKKATILFLVVVIAVLLVTLGVWITLTSMTSVNLFLKILMLLPALVVMLAAGYVFPLQAQFENNILNTLKNACIMSSLHFLISLFVLISNLFPIVILILLPETFLEYLPIWITLSGSMIAYINTVLLQRVFKLYIPSTEARK